MLVSLFKNTLPFLLCLLVLNTSAQGLLFKSNDSLLTQRTSMTVFGADPPVFHDHFSVAFDLSLWDNSHLGYVFNVSDKDNSYSLTYLYRDGAGGLNFTIDCKSNKIAIPLPDSLLRKRTWIRVRLDFDLKKDKMAIFINGQAWYADQMGFNPKMKANLIFGKNPSYTEVPNMAVKNLEVSDARSDYFFPLDEWTGNNIHDSRGVIRGSVENPVWLINSAYFWRPVYAQSFDNPAGLNFDPLDQRLFIFSKDSLVTYDPATGEKSALPYANQMPVPMVLGKSIFNARQNKCYVYELFDIPKGTPSVAALDMNRSSLRWTPVGKTILPQQLHHHNIFYDPAQDKFCLFGGYGAYSYHNSFLQYDPSLDQWDKIKFTGDTINPRFFAATGSADSTNEIFLFGGYGNESGSQVVGGRQYYDLYRINLKQHTIRKCWNISPGKDVFVPANNLILSKDKKYFYVLCYPHEIARTELRLYKFSVTDGSYEAMGAPIPVNSMRIESDINLFRSAATDEFFCTVQEFTDRKNSSIKIYSLTAPPVAVAEYLAANRPPDQLPWPWLYLLALPLAVTAVTLFLSRPAAGTQTSSSAANALSAARIHAPSAVGIHASSPVGIHASSAAGTHTPSITGHPAIAEPSPATPPIAIEPQPAPLINAVYLLGEFTVYDRSGMEITHLFSPKIKQLFVLILLSTKEKRGITSKKISAKLWPDKDPAATKNIKGVTLNHLRSAISDLDGIGLIFQNDTYSFQLEEGFFCDYCRVTDLLRNDPAAVLHHLNLALRGPLLPGMPDDLLDDQRQAYELQLTDTLLPLLKKQYESADYKAALETAKLILSLDIFNETALKYQLKCFRKLKGIDYSRKVYDRFVQDYERSLGTEYQTAFDNILQ